MVEKTLEAFAHSLDAVAGCRGGRDRITEIGSQNRPPRVTTNGVWGEPPPGFPDFIPRTEERRFQDFSSPFIVQRSWADPRFPDSWVHAWVVNSPLAGEPGQKACQVEFQRRGWGCDITFKPNDNIWMNVEDFQYLVVRLKAHEKSLATLLALGKPGIAFRLRVVDDKNHHWAWGTEMARDTTSPFAVYRTHDAKGTRLTLTSAEPKEFVFDLTTRVNWSPWNAEGSIDPRYSTASRFRKIELVVVEPGIAQDGEDVGLMGAKDHERVMDPSPPATPSTFYVLAIGFRR